MVKLLESQQDKITAQRRNKLEPIALAIANQLELKKSATVQFVCTHNSRRSQTAEFLLDIIARHNNIPITAISAGTESTAFNIRMIQAIESYGFQFIEYGIKDNPLYIYQEDFQDLYYYSKTYEEELIPYLNKIVVTVCDDASENCPVIPGTHERLHLNYKDPKHSDNTEKESETYRDKVVEIGREMLWIVNQIKSKNSLN